jgi:hypothetical protein
MQNLKRLIRCQPARNTSSQLTFTWSPSLTVDFFDPVKELNMRRLAALISFMFLAFSAIPVGAQTPAPASPPGAAGAGMANYWWILLVILVVAAVWYFMRGRNRV